MKVVSYVVSLALRMVRFIGFVAKCSPIFYVIVIMTFIVVGLDYLGTSLMVPMAPGQTAGKSFATQIWIDVAEHLGLEIEFRTWLWLFFVIMAIRIILGYVLFVLTTWLGKSVHRILSGKIFSHILLKVPMGEVYTRSVGHYITMAGDEVFKSGTIVHSLLQALVGFFGAAVGMFVLYQFSPLVFWSITSFLIISLTLILVLLRWYVRLNHRADGLTRGACTTFLEGLNNLRSIRSLRAEGFISHVYSKQMYEYLSTLVKMDAVKTGIKTFPALVLLLIAMILLAPTSDVSIADSTLFAGTLIVIRVFVSLGQMTAAGSQLVTDFGAIQNIGEMVEMAQDKTQSANCVDPQIVHSIRLDQLSFAYGDRGLVLNKISFRFEIGRMYAIIGPSGSGKSTLADLLLGLSLPSSGAVIVNGGEARIDTVRSRILLVEQQPKIFSTTVKENLLLGADIADEELLEVLEVVSLSEMVRALDQGLDTRLTYLGENLSGGQRQRLGIARALLRRPDVLILDEATSALDPVTRADIVGKLRDIMRKGIVIFITHDLEIAALADEMLQIE